MDQFDELPELSEKDRRPRFYTQIADGEDFVDQIAHYDPAKAAAHRAWQTGQFDSVDEAVAHYKSEHASEKQKAEIQDQADAAAKRKAAQANKSSAKDGELDLF